MSFPAGLLVEPVSLDSGLEPVEAGGDVLVLVGGDPGAQYVREWSRELRGQVGAECVQAGELRLDCLRGGSGAQRDREAYVVLAAVVAHVSDRQCSGGHSLADLGDGQPWRQTRRLPALGPEMPADLVPKFLSHLGADSGPCISRTDPRPTGDSQLTVSSTGTDSAVATSAVAAAGDVSGAVAAWRRGSSNATAAAAATAAAPTQTADDSPVTKAVPLA